jgi:hypothetical protein
MLAGATAFAAACVLASAPGTALAAQIQGPATSRVGGKVTFSANAMPSGTYTMRLVYVAIPAHVVVGTNCVAQIGAKTRAVGGRVEIAGRLPARLACSSGAGPVEGYYTVKPGHYSVTISRDEPGMPFGGDPFLRRALALTS